MSQVIPGLEVLLQDPPAWVDRAPLGLLCHPPSVDRGLRPAPELVARRFPGQLRVLFSPQHGLRGEKQDNMMSSPDFEDPLLQVPVVSLYGPRLDPPLEALQDIAVLLVDLQDVGTRVYTYGATLAKVMAAAARVGVRVAVLDRPNPIGGLQAEGNLLKSFELFGAPFLEPRRVRHELQDTPLPGVVLREVGFEPTFHKWAGELCHGFQLHITDRRAFKPYYTTLVLLSVIRRLYPEDLAWRQPPYEYETERLPIDLLTGDAAIREAIDANRSIAELAAAWQPDLDEFRQASREFWLYS
ncbi:MAG: DUF1343 domain-containing protein [Syntrophobacterales bacterium]